MKITPLVKDIQAEPETKCSISDCNMSFKTSSNLEWHLKKHHNLDKVVTNKMKYPIGNEYHCPIDGCVYCLPSERSFNSFQNLKQHFMKIHAEKKHVCSKCSKGYSRTPDLKRHELVCGIIYRCSCGYSYTCRETLLTHARRSGHKLSQDNFSKKKDLTFTTQFKADSLSTSDVSKPTSSSSSSKLTQLYSSKPPIIFPKSAPISCLPLPTMAAIALSELSATFPIFTGRFDAGTQTTVLDFQLPKGPKHLRPKQNKSSAQTQTSEMNFASPIKGARARKKRVHCNSTESQTNLVGLKPKVRKKIREKASQSKPSTAKNKMKDQIWDCLEKDEIEPLHVSTDVMLSDVSHPKNSSATQTSPHVGSNTRLLNQLCDAENVSDASDFSLVNLIEPSLLQQNSNAVCTQTEFNYHDFTPLNQYLMEPVNVGEMLNTETQTTENYLEGIDYSQLFNNMETQTVDNIFSLDLHLPNDGVQSTLEEDYNQFISTETQT